MKDSYGRQPAGRTKATNRRQELELEDPTRRVDWKEEVISWIKVIITAALIAFVLNTFIIANSKVPSGSMENTIMTGDRVIGLRLAYRFGEPEFGDVAIFRFPDDPEIYYVKRIIGVPGDIIDIYDGHVYRNGSEVPLDEPYLKEPMVQAPPLHYEVPADHYFALGDNRNLSADARVWINTYVPKEYMIAKVYFRYYTRTKGEKPFKWVK
ncbi:MAG: signal peptidase I [Lachnospiraceae bacterium]|nr:signal peptidase I [Lachnospiraceae bacterium]